ncbi:MAG TPA: PLP-dependent aspartate aminotransferase family protein [Gaiellaceae bacterium]|nr:PLP-dependent aspartate aminotransferase family protein [Gaiellaceae bacterium]
MPRGFSTRAIHTGEAPDPATGAHATPIYQTATFAFETSRAKDEAVEAGMSWQGGFFYSRTGNPTTAALEAKLADLEGAEDAVVGASGMAALSTTLLSLLQAGDHLVSPADLFVITRFLVEQDLPRRGVQVTSVDTTDLEAVRAALRPETRVLLTESVSNPHMLVADVPALAELAAGHGALLVVDNTFLTPFLLRPLEHGADLVVHSATKYLAGHGDALAGVVAGPKRLLDPVRWELDVHGSCASPFNAWLVLRGVRTLGLRLQAHCANALALAQFLDGRPEVDWVRYPGLDGHPQHALARRLLGERFGGMLSFRLRGGEPELRAFADALRLSAIAVSLGDLSTLVYPQPKRDCLIRVSVGCEDIADLFEDFERGLAAVRDR